MLIDFSTTALLRTDPSLADIAFVNIWLTAPAGVRMLRAMGTGDTREIETEHGREEAVRVVNERLRRQCRDALRSWRVYKRGYQVRPDSITELQNRFGHGSRSHLSLNQC